MIQHKSSYQILTIRLKSDWAEVWVSHCFELGASGFETIEETHEASILATYFTDLSISMNDVFTAFLQHYALAKATTQLIKTEICPEKDWSLEWKRHFQPIPISDKIIVCPPWDIPDISPETQKLIINPGNGFGSGSHPSTLLALRLLIDCMEISSTSFRSILDVGTGSGILLIAARYLGLTRLVGIDIDLPSIYDALNNFHLNQMNGHMQAICGSPECIDCSFDIVISNMMLHELTAVRNALLEKIKPGSILIVSGFYISQKTHILQCFEQLQVLMEKINDEWCGLILRAY